MLDVKRGWKDAGYIYYVANEGCEFVLVRLEVRNIGPTSSKIPIEDDMFRMRGTGIGEWNFNCNGNPFTIGPSSQPFDDEISGGKHVVGDFISEIPVAAENLRLEFAPNYLGYEATIFLSLEPDLSSDESVLLPTTPTLTPTAGPTATITPTAAPLPPSGIPDELYETMQQDMLILVNTARLGDDLKLSTNQAAQNHAEDMRDRCYFSHTSLDGSVLRERFRRTGGGQWRGLGENIHLHGGCDGGLRPGTLRVLAADAHRSLMDSPGHRRNILNPSYDEVAFGFAFKPGGLWVVQVFIDR